MKADIAATGTNLTGQQRKIEFREILDPEGAVYYIGELPIHNMETYRFNVEVAEFIDNFIGIIEVRQHHHDRSRLLTR